MSGFRRHAQVPHPPGRVFDFLLDPTHAKRVMKDVEAFEPLDPGPVRLGTRFSQTRVVNGVRATAIVEVVCFEPGRALTLRGGAKGVQVQIAYRLRPAQGGTEVELECEVWGRGVMRVLTPVILQYVERLEGDHLERLARALGPTLVPTRAATEARAQA